MEIYKRVEITCYVMYNIIRKRDYIMVKYIELPTVGKILKEEFLEPLEINQKFLAEQINVPAGRICEIINGKRIVTADTDLRLTKYFGLSEGYFLRMQANLDLRRTKREKSKDIEKIVPFKATLRTRVAKVGKKPQMQKETATETLLLKQM